MKMLKTILVTAALVAQVNGAVLFDATLTPDPDNPSPLGSVGYATVSYTPGDARPVLTVSWSGFPVANYAEFGFWYNGGSFYNSGQILPPGGGSWQPSLWTLDYFDGAYCYVGWEDQGRFGRLSGTFSQIGVPEPSTWALVAGLGCVLFAARRRLMALTAIPFMLAISASAADSEDTTPAPITKTVSAGTIKQVENEVTLVIKWTRRAGSGWNRTVVTGVVDTVTFRLSNGSEVPNTKVVESSPFDMTKYVADVEARNWGVSTNVWPGIRTTVTPGSPNLILDNLPAGLVRAARQSATNNPPVLP